MRTILIVDDEFASLEVLAVLFEGEGYRTLKAGDGAEALRLMAAESVDLVVTDAEMPILDGPRMVERMRADSRLRALPVILMSANGIHREGVAPPVRAFIGKPLRFDQLLELVTQTLSA
jgi:CheY-like chemotaxis protein